MISLHRIIAVIQARLREFYRDRASLMWNLAMPLMVIIGFATIFSGEPEDVLVVGVLTPTAELNRKLSPLMRVEHITLQLELDQKEGIEKVRRHQLDLLLQPTDPPRYWVNIHSARGHIAEALLIGLHGEPKITPQRQTVAGKDIRYVDWLMPGILAMNMMFSCLWGVGWVVVRYRKNGVLRRLQATPLTSLEFLIAQVTARMMVVTIVTLMVYIGAAISIDFTMRGSHLALFLVFFIGAIALTSIGLLVASRIRSEELADGLLNLISWPMMILSGIWFSLENVSSGAHALAQLFPLTHLVNAARSIMIDGAGVADVAFELGGLGVLAVSLLALSARFFRWD